MLPEHGRESQPRVTGCADAGRATHDGRTTRRLDSFLLGLCRREFASSFGPKAKLVSRGSLPEHGRESQPGVTRCAGAGCATHDGRTTQRLYLMSQGVAPSCRCVVVRAEGQTWSAVDRSRSTGVRANQASHDVPVLAAPLTTAGRLDDSTLFPRASCRRAVASSCRPKAGLGKRDPSPEQRRANTHHAPRSAGAGCAIHDVRTTRRLDSFP